MATFIDIPDIATACPSGLDPLERAGKILEMLGLWVAIEGAGIPAVDGYGFISGYGRVVSTTGTDLDTPSSLIMSILSSGTAPTANPFQAGFQSETQLNGYQGVPQGTTAYILYIGNGRHVFYNSNQRWEDSRTGTERSAPH